MRALGRSTKPQRGANRRIAAVAVRETIKLEHTHAAINATIELRPIRPGFQGVLHEFLKALLIGPANSRTGILRTRLIASRPGTLREIADIL